MSCPPCLSCLSYPPHLLAPPPFSHCSPTTTQAAAGLPLSFSVTLCQLRVFGFFKYFIYFLAVLGLCCCMCNNRFLQFLQVGVYSLAVECGLLTAVSSLVSDTGFRAQAQQLCAQAQLLRSIRDLPGSGVEPMSPEWQVDSLQLSHQESPQQSFGHYPAFYMPLICKLHSLGLFLRSSNAPLPCFPT